MINKSIAIIGLGYVGLPLAIEFSKKYKVIGFDIDAERVATLATFGDTTGQVDPIVLQQVLKGSEQGKLKLATDWNEIASASIYIITVPTPIDEDKKPDLRPLLGATEMVASVLKKNDLVIFESTVYPGCTEEDCVPVLEERSGLIFNHDFFCGYSPERINVGDKQNTLTSIIKVTSGSTPEVAEEVDRLYASIITAGTHKAPTIKVAEASKAIENAQRDLNISFINELALIFDRMGIDTRDVLDAAGTKWNFMKYQPGLVGGHCIGVDPYYLTYKAEKLGYTPQVISSGRRVNENMGAFIADKVLDLLRKKERDIISSSILILGITFKENCADIRNSGVINLYKHLIQAGTSVDVYDPWADHQKVEREYSVPLLPKIDYIKKYDAVILAVAHEEFSQIDFNAFKRSGAIIYDIKGILDRNFADARL
ncbi:MAG: nucleotide sugar dehydrogenase [Taibaiella sp.]|jgi:UDP-N-acetyl-D-galactosamine dehydrogenase